MSKKDHHIDGTSCMKCAAWSSDVKRCGMGRLLPPTIKGGADAVKLFGYSYLCPYTKRETVIKIMKLIEKSKSKS